MTILVVAVVERCPAVAALRSMRLPHELVIAKDEYTYGQTLARYWRHGQAFINVEHDIVPWPGSLEAMWGCGAEWCGYEYPIGESAKLGRSLGCVLFSAGAMRQHPDVGWGEVPWNRLDAAVFRVMAQPWHVHRPPVAHLTTMKGL
jgi:hypothetical protein